MNIRSGSRTNEKPGKNAGRETHRRVTTIDGDFDNAVLRISTTYDSLSRVDEVTQYDNATVGSGSIVDQVQYTYDDWGNVEKFAMDRNSAITGGTDASDGYYDVDYAYEKATGGRQTIRLTSQTWPSGDSVTYEYLSTNDLLDNDASRVTRLKVGVVTIAQYAYTGMGQVVKTEYPQADVFWQMHGSTTGSYPDLDRFNRVTSSRWTKDLATDREFYDCDITYDRNSNITVIEDNVHTGFDVDYTNDSLNRLTQAEEGTWNGSSITSRTRDQQWTLDQVGNWDIAKLDLDGDNNWNESNEYNDVQPVLRVLPLRHDERSLQQMWEQDSQIEKAIYVRSRERRRSAGRALNPAMRIRSVGADACCRAVATLIRLVHAAHSRVRA